MRNKVSSSTIKNYIQFTNNSTIISNYCQAFIFDFIKTGAPKRSWTPNPLIRSQVLYPIELWTQSKKISGISHSYDYYMAEKEGFEPSIRFKPYTPLAGERVRPALPLLRRLFSWQEVYYHKLHLMSTLFLLFIYILLEKHSKAIEFFKLKT